MRRLLVISAAALVLLVRPEVLRPVVIALLAAAALFVGLRRGPPRPGAAPNPVDREIRSAKACVARAETRPRCYKVPSRGGGAATRRGRGRRGS